MKHFDPNDAARNRLTLWTQPVQITCELTKVNHEVWEQLCRDWLQVRRIEFVGGPGVDIRPDRAGGRDRRGARVPD